MKKQSGLLRDNQTGKCLGTKSLKDGSDPVLSMVTCNINDITQHWNVDSIDNKWDQLVKTNPVNPQSAYYSSNKYTDYFGNKIKLQSNSKDGFSHAPTKSGILVKRDTSGNLRVPFGYSEATGTRVINPSSRGFDYMNTMTSSYDGCVNTGYNARYFDSGAYQTVPSITTTNSAKRNIDDKDYQYSCKSKWDILYQCDGNSPSDNHECNSTSGVWECKSGYWGKNCQFFDESATTTADVYENIYNKCRLGQGGATSSSQIAAEEQCRALHTSQDWLSDELKPFWNDMKRRADKIVSIQNNHLTDLVNIGDLNRNELNSRKLASQREAEAIRQNMVENSDMQRTRLDEKQNALDRVQTDHDKALAELKIKYESAPNQNDRILEAKRATAINYAMNKSRAQATKAQYAAIQQKITDLDVEDFKLSMEIDALKKEIATRTMPTK